MDGTCFKSHDIRKAKPRASFGRQALMSSFKEARHLFTFAGLFVLLFVVFLVVRHWVVPKTFGQYGHYRAAAIGDVEAHPVKFAGHETCESCHTDILDVKSKGKHAHVNCEACHGALADHANDPSAMRS